MFYSRSVTKLPPLEIVAPVEPLKTLPASPDDNPLQSAVFFCGIEGDVTDYTSSWTTPTGAFIENLEMGTIVSIDNEKYTLQNGNIGMGGFDRGSILSVMRLLYSDAGEYICSITFTETSTTATATSMLTLNGI